MQKEDRIFDELQDLMLQEARKKYSETVIEHFLNPRNIGSMEDADCYTFMTGICGDTIGIFVAVNGETIKRASFITNGCGPTIACGSALTCMVAGMTIEDAGRITNADLIEYLNGLPTENTHCADLAVNTLRGALAKLPETE